MANNLRKFATESEYNSATLNYPSVSWITSTDTVHFDKVSPIHYKLKMTYSDLSTYDIDCDTATTLTQSDVTGGTNPISAITSAEIGDCISSIGQKAFSGCTRITSINIPNSVTTIGDSAFKYCSGLTSVTIPNTVTSIGGSAFIYCYSLNSVTIPNSVTTIEGWAFQNCSGLINLTIGSGVTSINSNAFSSCRSLTGVTVNASTPPTLGTNAFENTNDCPIYVPAASVEAYKNSGYWSDYARRIQAIIE